MVGEDGDDPGAADHRPRVLLIEDEPNIATAIAFLLGRDGMRVSTHSDGATALAAIERHRPDAVVLDAMLPGRSGFDLLAAIRGGARGDLPVLMLTAKGQAKDRDRAEALGVDRFMTKRLAPSLGAAGLPAARARLLDALEREARAGA